MIEQRRGNLLDVKSGYIVHGCNAQGVMGSGVAALIKYNYPGAYELYKNAYDSYIRLEGKMPVGINTFYSVINGLIIVNSITQEFFGRDKNVTYVDYKALNKCFVNINYMIMNYEYPSENKVVNFPLIGCGLANGEWKIVEEIIDNALDNSITKILWML